MNNIDAELLEDIPEEYLEYPAVQKLLTAVSGRTLKKRRKFNGNNLDQEDAGETSRAGRGKESIRRAIGKTDSREFE